MRIAFITFEFPPSVAIGGIGTYAFDAVRMLAEAGCDVEVFAAGHAGMEPAEDFGVRVHRLDVRDREAMRNAVVPVFAERHRVCPFDVMESPEIGAEGAEVAAAFPEVAVVVKLHTPSYLVGRSAYEKPNLMERARFSLGALRRGRWDAMREPKYRAEDDLECRFARQADEVAAPSRAIHDLLVAEWQLNPNRTGCFPLPFRPDPSLLALPLPKGCKTIGYLGRLEARKGVVELAESIPTILRRAPHLHFRFLGPSWPYRQGDMASWVRQTCRGYLDRLEFTGAIGKEQLAEEFMRCDVIILPSRWENFPFACWESLASGRAVIGSSAGGMGDVIESGISGLLIEPRSTGSIVNAVLSLAADPTAVSRLGQAGRQRVLDYLAPERVLPLQLKSYERAIATSRSRPKSHL